MYILQWLTWWMPQCLANWILRRATRLGKEFFDAEADCLIDLLLRAMSWAMCLCRPLRRNLRGFQARYGFATAGKAARKAPAPAARNKPVRQTAVFTPGKMAVQPGLAGPFTAKVTFSSVEPLRGFLFSGDRNILVPMLANEVSVEGNLNYLYKFAFLVRDLMRRVNRLL